MRVEAPTRKMVACPTHVPQETSTQCSLSFRMSPACKITNVTPKLHSTLRNTFQANASSMWVPECAWLPKFMMAPSLSIGQVIWTLDKLSIESGAVSQHPDTMQFRDSHAAETPYVLLHAFQGHWRAESLLGS